jgi:ketosteroid isomerase-like protein
MKRFSIVVALLMVTAAGAAAQSKVEAEIAAIDKGWGEAYVACNAKAWESLLADDLVFIHNSGSIDNKAAQVKSAAACPLESLNTQQTKVRLYGDNTAVLTGAMQGKTKSGGYTFDLLYSRVYIKQNGAWRLVNHQSTDAPKKRNAEKPGA